MRLDGVVSCFVQSPKLREHRRSAGRCEARGDNWGNERVGRVDGRNVIDGSTCVCHSDRGRGIFVVLWVHIRVHVTASYEGSLLFLHTDIGKNVSRRNVGGSEIRCGGSAMGQGSGNTSGVNFAGFVRI